MPTYLIVANQTLQSETLEAAVEERVRAGDATFYVVVPVTPVAHGLTWDEASSREAAARRLEEMVARLHVLNADASGELGAADPVDAACDALKQHPSAEVLLSTLPPGISRWLHFDVPNRMRAAVSIPVVVLTATGAAAPTPA